MEIEKEYMTYSLNMVAWFKMRGLEPIRVEKKNTAIQFYFDWTKELNEAITTYLGNGELRDFLEILRKIRMEIKKY